VVPFFFAAVDENIHPKASLILSLERILKRALPPFLSGSVLKVFTRSDPVKTLMV